MAKLSAEQIRNQFGLSFNEEHARQTGFGGNDTNGAIYSDETGEYIGTIKGYKRNDESKQRKSKDGDGYLRLDDGITGLQAMEDYGVKHGIGKKRSNWETINDVAGAASDILGESKPEEIEAHSETFDSQIPDQVVNGRNAIQDFNDNFNKVWSDNEAAGNNNSFMDEYSFAGKNGNSAPKWNGSNMKVSMTTNWEKGAEDQSVKGGNTTFKYANARDRAQSYSNQQVQTDSLGMP
jgi:hypothetical protein